jgi:hypothetical protein
VLRNSGAEGPMNEAQWIDLASSDIAAVRYSAGDAVLEVRFVAGRSYRYYGVPGELFEALLEAASKGAFFNREIRGRYGDTRID